MTSSELLIIEKLVEYGLIQSITVVQGLSFNPPKPYDGYDCSIRVADGGISNSAASSKKYAENSIVKEHCIIGNYINIYFNTKRLADILVEHINSSKANYGFPSLFENLTLAIEHTSMTPVYPINIATQRSSVIGNALKSTYAKLGATVTTHFFVEDMARNISLLQQGLLAMGLEKDVSENHFPENEKKDHFLGKAFVLSYYIIKDEHLLIQEKLDLMFLPSNLKIPEDFQVVKDSIVAAKDMLSEETNKKLCDICVEGHKETMEITGTMVDEFDYETKVVLAMQADDFKDSSYGQAVLSHSVKVPYFIRNLAYFSYLQKKHNKVISVISRRQKETLDETLDSIRDSSNIEIVYFGDVLISDDDESNVLDVIRDGVFHSVDQYIHVMTDLYKQPIDVIVTALKLKMLGVKTGKVCSIDDSAVDQYDEFFDMIRDVKKLFSHRENASNSIDAINPDAENRLLTLLTLLIKYEEIPCKCLAENSFHLMVKWIYDIVDEINTLTNIDPSLMKQGKLNEAIISTIENAFYMLDIDITKTFNRLNEA